MQYADTVSTAKHGLPGAGLPGAGLAATGWQRWREFFRHAFAVSHAPFEPTARQLEIVTQLVSAAHARSMSYPLLMALESSQTLGFVSGQTLRVLEPMMSLLVGSAALREIVAILEHRQGIEFVCQQVQAKLDEPSREPITLVSEGGLP